MSSEIASNSSKQTAVSLSTEVHKFTVPMLAGLDREVRRLTLKAYKIDHLRNVASELGITGASLMPGNSNMLFDQTHPLLSEARLRQPTKWTRTRRGSTPRATADAGYEAAHGKCPSAAGTAGHGKRFDEAKRAERR